jgi:hypothetical protein
MKKLHFALYLIIMAFSILLIAKQNKKFYYSFNQTNSSKKIMNDNNFNDYNTLWEKVQEFENNGLPQSADSIVIQIYEKAIKENNSSQQIKASIYTNKYKIQREEEGGFKAITNIENEIKKLNFPEKNILQNYLANFYWQYYTNNQYTINQRSNTSNFDNPDFRLWSSNDFILKITNLFDHSLQNTAQLYNINISNYNDLINQGNTEGRIRKPTLYHVLANDVLNFYTNENTYLTQPSYQFTINEKIYFSDVASFISIKINSKDSINYKLKAIQIYQDILKNDLAKQNEKALIFTDINRLNFIRENYTGENKETLYESAIQKLYNENQNNENKFYLAYNYAQFLSQKNYDKTLNDKNKFSIAEAITILEKIKKDPTTGFYKNECSNLLCQLYQGNLNMKTAEVNEPEKPILAQVSYQNITNLEMVFYKLNPEQTWQWIKLKYSNENRIQNRIDFLKKLKIDRTQNQILPNENDYRSHITNIKLPNLLHGKYIIVLKAKNQYNTQYFEEIIEMYVSNLAILSRNQKGDLETLFTHRTTGEPIRNAVVNKYIASYMQDKNYYNQIVFSSPEKVKTDNNGFVITKNNAASDNQMHLFMINKEDDFFINENFLQTFKHYEQQYNNQYTSSILFTDRSIYRPLQTIYFKGICFDVTNNKSKLKTSFKDVIKLYDANYQEIKKIELTTNDYGSYAGKFELPDGLMTGNYTIRSSFGQVSFSVEEYKRPTFEVNYDTLKGSFRLNDIVKIKGIAKTYAGSYITDAKVKYRITRKAQFPYWYCYYWWLPYPQQNTMEIDNGTIYTNEKGEFEIKFKALADETIDKKTKPIFNFEINADITDLNGETRSATQYVNVGYVALVVDAQVVPILKKSKIDTLIINTKNVNGVFEPAKGKISIIKLELPNPKLREPIANWSKPDVFTMSETEFKTNFPLDVYKDENEYQNWEKRETILEKIFDTQKSKKIACDFVSTAPTGKYLINIDTKDAFDEPITYTQYVDLYDDVSNIADKQSPLMLQLSKSSIDINEKTDMCYESKYEKAWVLFEYSSGNNLIERTWVQPYEQKKCKTFTASALDINKKFTISTLCINNSRVYQQEMGYNVAEKPKTLQMKMSVFRNKLYPGQEETWKLKISGNDAEQVSAELLASMYDASLDAIKPHDWSNLYFPNNNHDILNYTSRLTHAFTSHGFNTSFSLSEYSYENNCGQNSSFLEFDSFNHFGFYLDNYTNRYYYRNEGRLLSKNEAPMVMMDESSSTNKNALETKSIQATSVVGGIGKDVSNRKDADKAYTEENKVGSNNIKDNNSIAVQIRKNFNETAFFLPQLETNPLGEVEIKFTLPDALTQWKFMALAHTKDMRVAKITENITASKDLMVFPNMPRFLREDDEIVLQTKISNISNKSLNGTVQLELLDINKDKSIAELFTANNLLQNFTVEKGKNTFASWKIKIPKDIGVVRYRITARTNTFSDGEENILPILSNEMLVTESLPLSVNKGTTKGFVFNKLKENNPNFRTNSLTLEYTSNPAWYAIQALPYLMEYPYECSEQTFSRLYANAIASHIANSNPKIKSVFEQWENTPALQSNLEKNQELKQLLLQQTPWVLEAKDESERKRRIGILFNIGKMKKEFTKAENTLFDMQLQNGGFPWFKGYPWDDRFITQHIVCGFGKLDKLGVKDLRKKGKTAQMINKALQYIDGKMYNDYLELKKYGQDESYTSSFISHYFYTRSFYDKSYPINDQYKIAFDYFYTRLQKHWLQLDKYSQGMAAIALYRNGDIITANKIIQSLKQNMYSSEEMGLYFVKETGYYWYQAPIETQAMMIEAFDEIANDQENIDKMKTWLLKQKQTQDWKTTKATVEACYALMLRGIDYLSESSLPDITIGGEKLQIDKRETEAGTGYFKKRWGKQDVTPKMAEIKITNNNKVTSWGALYWQYFATLDKITPHETPLKLVKKLFIEKPSDRGPIITPITENTIVKVGDKIKVRIELRVDRNMEYIHMKDMRASGFEPLNVLTQYKFQENLGYIESTRDASTDFFIAYLPKGEYVFEYPLRVFQSGNMSNGITNIQCMYAPEFTSHSEGVKVKVD